MVTQRQLVWKNLSSASKPVHTVEARANQRPFSQSSGIMFLCSCQTMTGSKDAVAFSTFTLALYSNAGLWGNAQTGDVHSNAHVCNSQSGHSSKVDQYLSKLQVMSNSSHMNGWASYLITEEPRSYPQLRVEYLNSKLWKNYKQKCFLTFSYNTSLYGLLSWFIISTFFYASCMSVATYIIWTEPELGLSPLAKIKLKAI